MCVPVGALWCWTPLLLAALVARDIADFARRHDTNNRFVGAQIVVDAAPPFADSRSNELDERRATALANGIRRRSRHALSRAARQPLPPLIPAEWPPKEHDHSDVDIAHFLHPTTDRPPTDWDRLIEPNPSPGSSNEQFFNPSVNNNNRYAVLPTNKEGKFILSGNNSLVDLAKAENGPKAATTQDGVVVSDHIQCYSCMSKFYEANWLLLQNLYNRPTNFSDACDFDPTGRKEQRSIGLVKCDSVCIKMYEQAQIGGLYVNGFTRGCYDNMLRRGFNTTLVKWYRWLQRDSCHEYSRKQVLQLGPSAPDGVITICTCYADGCNGSPKLSAAVAGWTPLLRWSTYVAIALYVAKWRT